MRFSTGGRRGMAWFGRWMLLAALVVSGEWNWSRAAEGSDRERQLQEELDRARREIERLRDENSRLKGQGDSAVVPDAAGKVVVPTAGVASPAPAAREGSVGVAPVVVVPAPIAEGELVTVERVLADYRASSLAGDARYKGRRVRIEGKVQDFKKVFVGMTWDVHLRAGDQLGLVRCRVSFPGISDFRGEGTPNLEGRRPFREWQTLMRRGETIVFEGICEGIDGAVVAFKGCRPAAGS